MGPRLHSQVATSGIQITGWTVIKSRIVMPNSNVKWRSREPSLSSPLVNAAIEDSQVPAWLKLEKTVARSGTQRNRENLHSDAIRTSQTSPKKIPRGFSREAYQTIKEAIGHQKTWPTTSSPRSSAHNQDC